MKIKNTFLPCLLCASLLISACSLPFGKNHLQKYSAVYFDYFDTVTNIIGYAESEDEFNVTCSFIESELSRYDNLYDAYDSLTGMNNMNYVNKHAGEEPVVVDEDLFKLFEMGKEIYELTDGKTNYAMGAVYAIWHQHRQDADYDPAAATLPSMEELEEAAKHCDIDDIVLDASNLTVYYADPLLKCDVGAFAKGYAIECIKNSLLEKGITGYSLNVGGNVRTLGTKPDGTPWSVAIQNPDLSSDDTYIELIKSTDQALTTSGSYQRYYVVDGVRYHHIINPDTLFPENNFLSVSILNDDAGIGDALSTAVFNLTLEEGLALINSMEGTEAMWVLPDMTKVYSDHFEEYVK